MTCESDALARAEGAYRAGDYREARRIARSILADPSRAPEADATARRILAATGIDPLAIAFFALSLGVFVFLVVRYVL